MHIDKYYSFINYENIDNNFKNQYNTFYENKLKNINKFMIDNNFRDINDIKNNFSKKYSNYKYLFCFSSTINELKNILKGFNQRVTGNKMDLYKRIYFYMYLMYSCVYIQKNYRNSIIIKLNHLHGPARINRGLCVNDSDFFNLDDIKDINYNEFYSYKDDLNFIYGFNIKSIFNLIKKNKIQNPYTLKQFSTSIINDINNFIKLSKLLNYNIDININDIELVTFEQKLNNVFHEIDLLGNYTNVNWFKILSTRKKVIFLKELHDIWIYRANIDLQVKLEIYPDGDPFLNLNIHLFSNNYNVNNLNNICVNIIENFVLYGQNNNSKSLGALYILSALTMVSSDAAEAMPWLYESVNYN